MQSVHVLRILLINILALHLSTILCWFIYFFLFWNKNTLSHKNKSVNKTIITLGNKSAISKF